MLSITAPVFDVDGCELIEPNDENGIRELTRRVSRTPTLDGEARITDFGYSDADRTLNIEWDGAKRDQIDNIARMVKAYGRLIISTWEGCFIGAPQSFSPGNNSARLTILVERRLDQ